MEELTSIIEGATADLDDIYFLLPIYDDEPIPRERVYCYEFYHQMRSRWPAHCPYWLNGEVDKMGHKTMVPLVGGVKPDFLVHIPGYMEGNHAVIEVKPHNTKNDGLAKDLATLSNFVGAGYDRAIYLIYGNDADRVIERVAAAIKSINDLPPIEVWAHYQARTPAIRKI